MCKKIEVIPTCFSKSFLAISIIIFAFTPQYSFGKSVRSKKTDCTFTIVKNKDGGQGIAIKNAGAASVTQEYPVEMEIYTNEIQIQRLRSGYRSIKKTGRGYDAKVTIKISETVSISVNDLWSFSDNILKLNRVVKVKGNDARSFMSGIMLTSKTKATRNELGYFVPGMMYGSTDFLTPSAIGGKDTFESGSSLMLIREDRLPAPLFGLRFQDGSSIAVLNPSPDGATTVADSHDQQVITLIDERFQFGSIASAFYDESPSCGFWFPGTEGEVTYAGNTYPDGQMNKWRRRYHPLKDGLTQKYQVSFRFAWEDDFPEFSNNAWRWAWTTLAPPIEKHDIDLVRYHLVKMLSEQVIITDGRAGIPNFITSSPSDRTWWRDNQAIFGFTGKNLETAYYLLRDSYGDNVPDKYEQRKLGRAIVDSFIKLKMDPPVSEGFNIYSGEPALAIPHGFHGPHGVFLRSLGDGMKATCRAYIVEEKNGTQHNDWLNWLVGCGNWLLTKQNTDGSFPRKFVARTGEVLDPSPTTSYNVVTYLALLSEISGSQKYFKAAVKAAEYAWTHGHDKGIFIGGTIDNPNVIDKEGGTLSLEAYLLLFEKTKDQKWLERAKMAGNFSETWTYIWNVPMPEEENDSLLHWKKGVSTVGLQLIATGHTLVDAYGAFNADEFIKLYAYTKDSHYYEVALVLLHDTKSMLALDGRPYDLNGLGWQQEHWSLAPLRGYGLHRGWLPWVSCAHLNGIYGIIDFDRELYQKIAAGERPY